jgi:hypothetical protein
VSEVHDLEAFFRAKLAELTEKVSPDGMAGMIAKLQAEYVRQFHMRWGIAMVQQGDEIVPASYADAEKLEALHDTDERDWMFDPRTLGRFVK